MDIDLLKSTPDDQIEMMLMMHMDKSSSSSQGGIPPYLDSHGAMLFATTQSQTTTPNTMLPLFDAHVLSSHPIISPFSNNNNNNNNNIPSPLILPNSSSPSSSSTSQKHISMAAMREMIFRIAAMQPIYIDPESVKPPKRRNVRISKDPQSVAARHRRERISERIRILQRLVPGGTKMDTASMLDEAIHYVKFLKTEVQSLERAAVNNNRPSCVTAGVGFPVAVTSGSGFFPINTSSKANGYSFGPHHMHQQVNHHHQLSDA